MLDGPQKGIVASLVLHWTLATAALVLRMLARRMTRMALRFDDYFCLAAYIFCVATNVWQLVWLKDGVGLHLEDITWLSRAEVLGRARRAVFFMGILGTVSLGSSKVSILGLYWRLFSVTKIRCAIMYLIFLSLCWLVARTIVGVLRCIPVVAYWDLPMQCEGFVDDINLLYAGSMTHLALLVAIIIVPILELRRLRLGYWRGLGVAAIFVLGIV
ncbi:unnamed protein product [Discula destructiva]